MKIDPNDLQVECDHRKFDVATDSCAICGKDWNTILWYSNATKPCCGGGVGQDATYSNGKWHSSDCDSLKPSQKLDDTQPLQIDYRPPPGRNRCECGAWATSNHNAHAYYCPEYKK